MSEAVASLPIVGIIGRPNVGKSTLFNRIIGAQQAIVDDEPGVTRDRHAAVAEWGGRRFTLVDTGGLVPESEEALEKQVNAQIRAAVEEADLCLLVVDGRAGITATDRDVAVMLRESGREAILVVNKADNLEQARRLVWEFYELGLGDPHPVSALNGTGSGDLLDAIVAGLPAGVDTVAHPDEITITVIGKPNVGKSSLLNRLVGAERFIVSPDAGTTRDAIDTMLAYEGRRLRLVDTAGIRRHAVLKEGLEYYTYLRAVRSLERAQIAIVVLDASQPLSRQDLRILNLVEERRRGIVVCLNKWDLVEKDERTAAQYEAAFRAQARTLAYAPIVTISAKTGQRVQRALEAAIKVWEEWHRKVPTPALNRVLHAATAKVQPPQSRGRRAGRIVRILYGHQVETGPPLVLFYSNEPQAVPEHYRRYLERALRDAFGFAGVPLRIYFRQASPKSRERVDAARPEGG
ncbi:MAG TPA: ribosome biogenesis GTPase Der [Gemmatimonadota bacterium]|nr:ribosome biogenesis GTPase Der [Gemmatimonadota bacterium]